MSVVKLLFKFIIIVVLFIVFALYYYTRKSKDGFQNKNDTDYHYPHFDISANYYELTQAERAVMKRSDPDSITLDVGNTFGQAIDRNSIPWDSENRGFKPSQVLWGVISREASVNIYHKIFEAQQIAKIKEAEENEFYFDSALLHFGTSDPNLGQAIKAADFIANFLGPLVVPMIGEKMGGMDPIFEWEVYEAEVPRQGNFAVNVNDDVMDAATQRKQVTPNMKLKHSRVADISEDGKPKTSVTPNVVGGGNLPNAPKMSSAEKIMVKKTRLVKINGQRSLGKLISFYFDALELIPPPAGPILNAIYMVVIMPIVMAIALPLTAPRKGSDAIVEIQTANVYASLASMSATALLSAAFPGNIMLFAATMAAALWGALAAFYQQQVAVPAGYKSAMEQMLQQTGHGSGDGKCPNGYVPLDQIWNPTTQMFISFFPIIGDLIDLLYPYLCIRKDATAMNDRGNVFSQLVCIRDPYVLPKYMEQSWISSMFLEWPNYNNKLSTGTNIVGGKLRIVPDAVTMAGNDIARGLIIAAGGGVISSAAIAAAGGAGAFDTILPEIRTGPYWSWSGYTNFNDIKNNPNNYYNLNVKLENFQRNMTYEFIGGRKKNSYDPDTSFKFFYLDFSDPNILIEMGQFYYNYAIRNPQLGDDRTFTIEYIAKINYVTSSSLFSCDAMCEMISVQYDARNGKFIKELRTYDSDRRFYFRWKPEDGVSGTCMPVTNIWGNDANNQQWRQLDDNYDNAMYALNDAIHFPTDPTHDPTGLISGDLLLTGYELYLEQKERSDAAADYIVYKYTTFRYTIPEIVRDNSATAATLALSFAETAETAALTRSNAAASAATAAAASAVASAAAKAAAASAAATALAELSAAQAIKTLLTTTVSAGVSVGKSLDELKAIYVTLFNSIRATTAQLGQDESVTRNVVNENLLKTAKDNYENALQRADPFYLDFKMVTDTAETNYIDLLGKLYTTNEDPNIFFKNDLVFRHDIVDDLQSKMNDVITAREALWIKHKRDVSSDPNSNDINNLEYMFGNTKYVGTDNSITNPIRDRISEFLRTKYYDVTACTHIDGTAPAAVTPDVTSEQTDIRFPCKFDLLPHLKRCQNNMNIRLDKCIDLSNIEQIIQAVERQKPDIRIKTIHNIKARGNNTCQYIWDEYNKNTPETVIRTTNRILYQQDISACTFCLPEGPNSASDPTIVQKIYVDNSDIKEDQYIEATKKYQVGTTNIVTSLGDLTVPSAGENHYFQPLTNYMNSNGRLVFKKARYSDPIPSEGGGAPSGYIEREEELYVPRYDINNNSSKLPDLVRPKKPIRVSYPNGPESSLGETTATNFSNYCSDPVNMSNFMLRYNRTNPDEMIINIQRAFTTNSSRCDYEIDVFIKDPIQKNIDDEPITSGGNTIPLLQGDIRQIQKIDLDGKTTVSVVSADNFFKRMTVDIRYNISNSVTYRLVTSLIVGVGKLTPNIFNPYEINIRTALGSLLSITATNIIVGFNLEKYKLSGIIMDFIGIVKTLNTVTNIQSQAIFIVRISNYNALAVNTPTIFAMEFLNRELSNFGNLTSETVATYVTRELTITEALTTYNTASSIRTISQAIQGLRVITDVNRVTTPNTITYYNDIDKIPLDIYYTASDSTTLYNRNIPNPAPTTAPYIGKMTLKNTVTRKTVSYNMTSSASPLTEAYVNKTPFTYDSLHAAGDGLEIKRNTSTLNTLYSNTGYNFGGPAKSNIDSIFGPNTTYYNDNLVVTYTSNISTISGKTSDFLRPIVQAIKLSNVVGGANVCAAQASATNPTNVCSNTNYMQRIMDAYNNGNSPIGIFNQERNTMVKIIQSSTADDNKCHVIFENKNERFRDITNYNSYDPNNYIVTNTLKFMSFPMDSNVTLCDFTPKKIPATSTISASTISIYPPIKASDVTLSYSDNFSPPYVKSLRNSICQVGDTVNLFNSVRDNYSALVNVSGNPLSNNATAATPGVPSIPSKLASRIVGYDKIDYLLSVNAVGGLQKVILRAKFDLSNYPAECGWFYTADSFKVQVVLRTDIIGSARLAYTNLRYVEVVDSNTPQLGRTDNISPLIYYPSI